MKILFCSDALTIDGVTSYILNTGAALKRAGYEIAVLGRWAGKGFQSHYKHENFRVISSLSPRVGNIYFDFEENILSQLHEIKSGLEVVKMPRPLDVFFAPSKLPARDPFNILCFGRLSRYKTPGIFYLLDNIKLIREHIPGIRINILGGEGWRLYKIKCIARKINKSLKYKCVNIIGTQDNPRNYIENANLILGGATSAMEAAYSLRPVIAMSGNYFGQVTT